MVCKSALPEGKSFTRIHLDIAQDGITLAARRSRARASSTRQSAEVDSNAIERWYRARDGWSGVSRQEIGIPLALGLTFYNDQEVAVRALATLSTGDVQEYLDLDALLRSHPELQIAQDTYNINVTSQLGQVISADETLERIRSHSGAGLPAHLYFHVPLCSYICHFCNYVKRLLPDDPNKQRLTLDRWVDLLLWHEELESVSSRAVPWVADSARIESIFIGQVEQRRF